MSVVNYGLKDKSEGREEPSPQATEERLKSRKKEKKSKRKREDDSIINDSKSELKKEKKKRRKENGNDDTQSVTPEIPSDSKGEKKKKRSRMEEDEKSNTDPSLESTKVKKKKRSKEHKESEKAGSIDQAETPEVSGKEKKKKKKKETDPIPELQTIANNITSIVEPFSSATFPSDSEVSAYLSKHGVTVDCGSGLKTIPDELKPTFAFSSLFPRIPTQLHAALSKFSEPTPIQACSWPPLLAGRDVVGIAETGSGKTLAFGIPALTRVVSLNPKFASEGQKKSSKASKKQNKASVLVLAPTRELAIQTHETLLQLGKPFGLTSVALFGGVDKGPQRHALNEEGAAMIVGTPGRILDLINEGACDLSGVKYLVLDEADRMLDKGFENDIRSIIGHTSAATERQTLMFSATWPDAVRKLASSFLKSPVRVTVGSDDLTANRRVEQVVEVFDDTREKDSRLFSHLRTLKARKGGKQLPDESRILVFVLYKKEAARVEQTLQRQGFSVGGIHGDLSQQARMAALEAFKTGETQLLVATDVAARGLDIPNVGTVINYSFPLTTEDYIHRIGRTGRGGKSGKSITFFTGDNHERALAGELAKVLREGGFDTEPLKKFPMTIKKKTHSVYGAHFRDDIPMDAKPTRLTF